MVNQCKLVSRRKREQIHIGPKRKGGRKGGDYGVGYGDTDSPREKTTSNFINVLHERLVGTYKRVENFKRNIYHNLN